MINGGVEIYSPLILKIMTIQLLRSAAGFGYAHEEGEVIEVPIEVGTYMIECGAAIEVKAEKSEPKKKK